MFPNKSEYNCVIPQNIFQTWHSKILPPLMFRSVESIKKHNPGFKHYLFDDNDCREFIKSHFKPDVLDAYDRLIPGAYKADLWRYCVLFIHGGIYLDIKYKPFEGFKFINLCEKEHLTLDIDDTAIYNAVMVCKQGNPNLLKAIRQIVSNVQNKFYGEAPTSPTGPKLLAECVSINDEIVDLKHVYNNINDKYVYYKDIPIMNVYNGQEEEKNKNSLKPHYIQLWCKREIYA